jgi:threonine dehydrogenase-like Zn-dependent dehydrogenase
MKSVAVIKADRIEIVDVPEPQCGEYDALVKSEAAFICNATDRKVVEEHFPGLPSSAYPVLLGHENVGRVVEVGPKVRSYRVGDRVIGGLVLSPGGGFGSGWGGNSEFVLVKDHQAMVTDGVADTEHGWDEIFQIMKKVPEEISIQAAGLLCTWREVYGGFEDFRLKKGDDILIFGAGPVGLSFVQFAKILGLGWVGSVDPLANKRDKAVSLGADAAFAPDDPALSEVLRARGRGFDAVIDAVGHESIINRAVTMVRMAGSVCVYGVVGPPKITIDKSGGPYNFNVFVHQWPTRTAEAAAHEKIISLIRSGRISHEPFVSGEFSVSDFSAAYAATRREDAIKTMVRFDRWQ